MRCGVFATNPAQAPISAATPTVPHSPTYRRPNPATETGARAPGPWCRIRDAGAVVCARPGLSAALPATAGISVLARLTRAFELDRGQAERDPDPRAEVRDPKFVLG